MVLELYATKSCPYCTELREKLEWDGLEYLEYDVEDDEAARLRLLELAGTDAIVPVLVADGRVSQVGVGGRGCYVGNR
jgi:mycoredoxin